MDVSVTHDDNEVDVSREIMQSSGSSSVSQISGEERNTVDLESQKTGSQEDTIVNSNVESNCMNLQKSYSLPQICIQSFLSSTINSFLTFGSVKNPPPEAVGLALDAIGRGVISMSYLFIGPALLYLAKQEVFDRCFADLYDEYIESLEVEDQDFTEERINAECEDIAPNMKVYGMKPSSLLSNMAAISGLCSAFIMPFFGTIVDHTPYRRQVGAISAGFLAMISSVQIILSQDTWAILVLLQFFGGFSFYAHNVSQYAYTSELSSVPSEQTSYNARLQAIMYSTMLIFLVIVMTLSNILNMDDVDTARLSQVFTSIVSASFFMYAWAYYMSDCQAKSRVPEGSMLMTCGLKKLMSTFNTIKVEYLALKWFLISICLSEAAASSFISIATTYMSHFLEMSSSEIGLSFFLSLISGIPGAAIGEYIGVMYSPLFSIISCLYVWLATTTAGAFILVGPESRKYIFIMCPLWGICLGWLHPLNTAVFCTIIPKGQETELMGLYIFAWNIISWLPPLLFTILNEAGYPMNWGLCSVGLFYVAALISIFQMGDYEQAVKSANGKHLEPLMSKITNESSMGVIQREGKGTTIKNPVIEMKNLDTSGSRNVVSKSCEW